MVSSGQLYESLREYEKDNYYLLSDDGKPVVPEKIGNAWAELEKNGEIQINEKTYRDLKAGINPNTGEQLAQNSVSGEHRSGINFTFSPEKSWTAFAHTSEKAMQDVKNIHNFAMADVVRYMESNLIQARQTTNGVTEPVKTNSLLAMRVDHRVSNAGDVQLHSHLCCYNETFNKDTGKWQALHNDPLHSDVMQKLYENGMAFYAKELGYAVEWKESDTGKSQFATLAGVQKEAVESLSTRAIQIDKYYEEHKAELHAKYPNADVGEIKQTITNMTRQDKVSMTKEQIDARYTKEINSAGLNKEDIALGVHRAAEAAQEAARDNIKMNQYELIRTAANGLVSGEGRFSAQDLLKTAADLSRGDVSLPRLQEAVEALSKDKEIIKQADSYTMRGRGNRTYNDQSFTTPEVLRAEKYIMDYATDSQGKAAPVTTQEKAQEAIKQYEQQQRAGQQKQGKESDFKFTDGQKQVIEHIASNSHGVIDIEGSAGAGKTRALDAVREIAEKAGWEVKGFAPSGKAAEELEKSAGIVSRTVDKFLIDQVKLARGTEKLDAIKTNYKEQLDKAVTFDRLTSCFTYELKTELNTIRAKDRVLATMPEQPTGKPQLWIVDEKSMLGSVKMAELMQWAGKADAKVVFTGDTRQMQSIEAGNMFKKMQEAGAVQTVRMNENIRQRDNPEYRQAMQDLSNKKIDKAMDRLDSNGKISEIADRGERLQAIKEDYLSRNYKNTVIVTDRNDDRNEINKSIREGLKEQGKLKGEDRTFTVRESKNLDGTGKLKAENYQAGDIIKGHNLKGITNGQEVAVKSADPGSHTLTVVDREGKEHSIDTRRDGDRITNVYQENDRGFCKGEKIVFLRNDEGLGVKNGNVAIIKSMDDKGNITVKMESGRELKFNPQTQYNYITAGFAVSVYKSEGGTWQNALVHADSKKDTTFNSQYVAQSRGKQDIQIYTDNKAELREQMKTEQHKTSTLDFVKTEIGKEQGGPEAEKAEGPEQKSENGQQGKSAANETAAEKSGKIETEQGKTDKGYLEVCENTKETAEQQTEAKQEEHDKKETHEFETEQQTGKETEHVEVEHNSKHEEDEAYDHSHGHEAAAEHSEYETDRETEHGAGVEHEAEEAQEQEREIDFD